MNLYIILGIDTKATSKEIREAWIILSKENHPDKGGDVNKMTEINLAYEILSNKNKRERYDRTGNLNITPFTVQFQELMNGLLDSLIDSIEPTKLNVVEEFIAQIKHQREGAIKQKRVYDKRVTKTNTILTRLKKSGDGSLEFVLNAQLHNCYMVLGNLEDKIEFLEKAQEVLEKYGYDIDEQQQQSTYFITWNG